MAADNIIIKESFVDKAEEVKELYITHFKDVYTNLETLHSTMLEDSTFSGSAKEGFLEVFEILLLYQNKLITQMDDYYPMYKDLESNLSEIEKFPDFQKIKR